MLARYFTVRTTKAGGRVIIMKITPTENRGIDEDLFHTLCTLFEDIPIHKTLGMSLTYLGPGVAAMKMNVEPEYTTIKGRLHGESLPPYWMMLWGGLSIPWVGSAM